MINAPPGARKRKPNMKKHKNLIRAGLLIGFALSTSAASIDGYLIDKMCSPACQKSGYAVVTADGKLLSLDAKGNQEAIKALKATKKQDDLRVTVNGDVSGDSIKVTSLKLQ